MQPDWRQVLRCLATVPRRWDSGHLKVANLPRHPTTIATHLLLLPLLPLLPLLWHIALVFFFTFQTGYIPIGTVHMDGVICVVSPSIALIKNCARRTTWEGFRNEFVGATPRNPHNRHLSTMKGGDLGFGTPPKQCSYPIPMHT